MTKKTYDIILDSLEFSKQIMLRHLDGTTEKDNNSIKEIINDINFAMSEIENIKGA